MSKWNDTWKESDDTHTNWGRSNDSRADDWTAKSGDNDSRCHYYNNKESGESGVVHRGGCKVCDDNNSSSDGGSGK